MENPFKDAAKQAAEETNQHFAEKIFSLTASQINNVLDELKKSSVSKEAVESIEKIILSSTDKNKKLKEIVDKGDELAKVIMNIIKLI